MVKSSQSGVAAIMAIAALLIVGIAMSIAATCITAGFDATRSDQRRVQLGALGDAAMAEALAGLAANPSHSGHSRHAFGDGWISSKIEGSGSTRRVTAKAEWSSSRTIISAVISFDSPSPRVVSWQRTLH